MAKNTVELLLPEEVIMSKIYFIRGNKVMIDRDLGLRYAFCFTEQGDLHFSGKIENQNKVSQIAISGSNKNALTLRAATKDNKMR